MNQDYEKQVKAAMSIVDINVKAMNSIIEKQSALMKDILENTMQSVQNTSVQPNMLEENMKKGMEMQKKVGSLIDENINIIRKAGQDISNLLVQEEKEQPAKPSKASSSSK